MIDTPISEKAIAGAAVGAAVLGMRPIADMQYSDFLFECMDELVNQAAKLRYMSGGKLSVPMVMRAPVGATTRGAQHGQCPESYFAHVPGLKVVAPSDAYNAKGILKSAIRDNNPVLVFEHKLLYGSKGREAAGGFDLTCEVPLGDYVVPIGQAVVKRPGRDVTVVATHISLYRALAAAEELAERGHRVRGDRPPHPAAAGRRDHIRLGPAHRPSGDRARGHPHRRLGRRGGGPGGRRMPVLPGGPGQEGGHVGRPHALRTHPRGRGAAEHRSCGGGGKKGHGVDRWPTPSGCQPSASPVTR